MRSTPSLAIAVFISGLVAAATAPPAAAAPSAAQKADIYIEAATKLFRAKAYEGALLQFRGAAQYGDAVEDQAGLRYNIARCLEELRRPREALAAFEGYLELDDDPQTQALARRKIAALEKALFGQVVVRCRPEGALATIRGVSPTRQPCPVTWPRVEAGEHEIELANLQGVSVSQRFTVIAGRANPVTIELPLAQVKAIEAAPAARLQTETPGTVPPSVLTWSLAGGSVAALTGGLLFLLESNGSADDARAAKGRYEAATEPALVELARAEATTATESARTERALSYVLFGLGVGLAGAAGWSYLDDRGDLGAAWLAPLPGGAALVWRGAL